jgi:hypothetical protein
MLRELLDRVSKKQDLKVDPDLLRQASGRADALQKSWHEKCHKKQSEIQQFRNTLNRMSLRFSYKDLANLHLRAGGLKDASVAFMKVHENNIQTKNTDFAVDWVFTLLWMRNYPQIRVVNLPKPARPFSYLKCTSAATTTSAPKNSALSWD